MLNQREKKVKKKWIHHNKEIKLDLNKKLVRFITQLKDKSTRRQTVKKTHTKQNNGIYNTYHGLLSQEWIDRRYWSLLWYIMLTKVMNSTSLWFRVVLASSRNNVSGRVYWPERQHPSYKTTNHSRTEEPLNKISTLESSDMLQNWNLIER